MSYFTNSGSEANELAVLMAREKTGRNEIIAIQVCHGGTSATMGLTAVGTWKFKSNPSANVKHALAPYCYRCPYGLEFPSCGLKCARRGERFIRQETSGEPACFIAESIQGVGGTVTPPPGYFQIVYDIVQVRRALHRRRSTSRLRSHRRAFLGLRELGRHAQHRSRWPKASATAQQHCVARPELAAQMKNRIHFNTYGGNPISMTQGLATLEVIDAEGIRANALKMGAISTPLLASTKRSDRSSATSAAWA